MTEKKRKLDVCANWFRFCWFFFSAIAVASHHIINSYVTNGFVNFLFERCDGRSLKKSFSHMDFSRKKERLYSLCLIELENETLLQAKQTSRVVWDDEKVNSKWCFRVKKIHFFFVSNAFNVCKMLYKIELNAFLFVFCIEIEVELWKWTHSVSKQMTYCGMLTAMLLLRRDDKRKIE